LMFMEEGLAARNTVARQGVDRDPKSGQYLFLAEAPNDLPGAQTKKAEKPKEGAYLFFSNGKPGILSRNTAATNQFQVASLGSLDLRPTDKLMLIGKHIGINGRTYASFLISSQREGEDSAKIHSLIFEEGESFRLISMQQVYVGPAMTNR